MKIEIHLEGDCSQKQFNLSKDALQRAIDGKPQLVCDYAPLIGLMGILEQIGEQVHPEYSRIKGSCAIKEKYL